MNTRKHPRTLVEAFGPYASGPIHEPQRPMHRSDRIALRAALAALAALISLAAMGVL